MVDEEIFLQYILKILYYFKHDKTDMHYCGLVQYIFCRIWREWIFGGRIWRILDFFKTVNTGLARINIHKSLICQSV